MLWHRGNLVRKHAQLFINYSKIEYADYLFTSRQGVKIAIKSSGGVGGHDIPGWVHAEPGFVYFSWIFGPFWVSLKRLTNETSSWHAEKSPPHSKQAIMSEGQPVRSLLIFNTFQTSNLVPLGNCWYEHFLRYRVGFWLKTRTVSANISSTDEILSIKVIGNYKECFFLECDILILAAGPWTPAVFTKLFRESSVDLEPVISVMKWFVFQESLAPIWDSGDILRWHCRSQVRICRQN